MAATKNHLYHTLSPLVLFAAFLVSLLAFLAPTPIFPDRVALLSVSTNVSSTASSPNAKRWIAEDALAAPFHVKRMVKRAKKSNSTAASSNTTTTEPVKIDLGPLGGCYSNSTSSDPVCTSPTFTPIFVELYDTLGFSTTLQDALPDQFPLAPTALFASLLLLAYQFLAVVFSSISMHASKKAAFLAKRQPMLRKSALVAGVISLAIGLAATATLRVQLGKVVDKLEDVGVTGKLGSGFDQFWAGLALQAVAVLLLVAEAFTSR
ncbi:hypothetical protein JCM6882_001884 [Rhodosporidiobolus microsporus]